MATVESQKRYMVTPSIESPAFRARMVVVMSARSGVTRGSPVGADGTPNEDAPPTPFLVEQRENDSGMI
jgi:hypothetical protein